MSKSSSGKSDEHCTKNLPSIDGHLMPANEKINFNKTYLGAGLVLFGEFSENLLLKSTKEIWPWI